MNPATILGLITDLYEQVHELGRRNAELEAENQQLRQQLEITERVSDA